MRAVCDCPESVLKQRWSLAESERVLCGMPNQQAKRLLFFNFPACIPGDWLSLSGFPEMKREEHRPRSGELYSIFTWGEMQAGVNNATCACLPDCPAATRPKNILLAFSACLLNIASTRHIPTRDWHVQIRGCKVGLDVS